MKQQHIDRSTFTPFLANYASKRTVPPKIQGQYCSELSMWVVAHEGDETSLIDLDRGLVELATKTSNQQETDD